MEKVHNLDLALVRAFVEVAGSGSMTGAATRLHLSQGGVSQRIARLEAFLGCQLLLRDTQGCRPSPQGQALLADARRLLELNDRFCAQVFNAQPAKPVRLGLPFDMAGAQLAPVLKGFAQALPLAQVKIHCASSLDIASAFARGDLDLALTQSPAPAALGEVLSVEPLVWLGSAATALRRPLPLCLLTHNCVFLDSVGQALDEAGTGWQVVYENQTVDTTLSMVASGLAVSPWLRRLVPEPLSALMLDEGLPELPAHAVCLHIPAHVDAPVLKLAELIRAHYTTGG